LGKRRLIKFLQGRKIADKRIYTSVREHGPRQLTYGIMTSEEDVDTVYIPIAMEAQLPPQVFYQGDRNIELQETQSWTTGVPIRTVGGSRLHVKKEGGPVCFLMVEFIKVQSEKQEGTEEKDKMEKD
jgi:hypothetical protein